MNELRYKKSIKFCNSCKKNVLVAISDDDDPESVCLTCGNNDVSAPDPLKGESVFELLLGMFQPELGNPGYLGGFMMDMLVRESDDLVKKFDDNRLQRSDLIWLARGMKEALSELQDPSDPGKFDYIAPRVDPPSLEDFDFDLEMDFEDPSE